MNDTDLSAVKVGDQVATMRHRHEQEAQWTGTLHNVTRVSEKRFMVAGKWVNKSNGREVGGLSGYYYAPATPAMLAERDRKHAERRQEDDLRSAFLARPEYRLASSILYALENMTHDHHPLDRLTLDEWALFHSKIVGET